MTACLPFRTANQAQEAATKVLPEPTSPWSKRFMRLPPHRSEKAWVTALRWALVGEKGRVLKNSSGS